MCSVELICVQSKKIRKIMHTHTHKDGVGIGYAVRQLPTSAGLSLDVRCFTIYQLGYTLGLSETRLPLSHSRLFLTIPYRNIEISPPYFSYAFRS